MNTEQDNLPSGSLRQSVIAVVAGLLVILVFFRQDFLNHFTYLTGDRYDGVIEAALLEHWFNVFRGLAHWNSPNYFFPYDNTLSHNEGLFLYGIIYSFFRALSLDALLSSELVNMTIKAIGFFAFLVSARRMLKLPFSWSLLGAAIFTLSNNSFLQAPHGQLLSVALAPIEAILIHAACGALMQGRSSRLFLWGSAASIFFAAWMMTCLYMAWFFSAFTIMTIAAQFLVSGKAGLERVKGAILEKKWAILGVGIVTAIALFPFYSVYFSGDHAEKQRPWDAVLVFGPSILDSINVGNKNFLFGYLFDWANQHCPQCDIGDGERMAGISPILFLITLITAVGVIRRKLAVPAPLKALVYGMAVAFLAMWLLSLRVHDHSGWYFMYKVWPGGSGLRVIARVLLFLSLPATGLAIWYLAQVQQKWPRYLVATLCVLLLVEEINIFPPNFMDRTQENERTVSVSKPPASCRAFFTTESPDTVDRDPSFPVGSLYPHNVDAMLIAEYVNLPTINGFASFNPPDWNFANPTGADYLLRVGAYAKSHGMDGLCQLNLVTKQWDAHPKFVETERKNLAYWDFAQDKNLEETLKGFDAAEPFGRWSKGPKASFKYVLPASANEQPLTVQISTVTALISALHSQRMLISINGGPKQEFLFGSPARKNIELTLPAGSGTTGIIEMDFPDAISPKALGMSGDDRPLGVAVKSIEFR